MSCPDMQDLLHAYVDGELDVAHTLEVERHLQGCPDCARASAELRELRRALQACLPRFQPPGELRLRISNALRHNQAGQPTKKRGRLLVALAASLALLALGLAGGAILWSPPSAHDRIAQEVIDSHIRSLLAGRHLLDVESSDRHQVKPWFQGKLDFAPAVRDLKEAGFILAGGRLDYVNGRPVAALVYHRRQHVINLLIWPGAAGENQTGPRAQTRQGYHLVEWQDQGMNWWAVSDLNPAELVELAQLLRRPE